MYSQHMDTKLNDAAPDLLAALKELYRLCDEADLISNTCADYDVVDAALKATRAAIAKATP